MFFCKYNDPPYVKVEKLDVMVRLASERNVDTLLGELKEYVLYHASKLVLVLVLTFSPDSR